MLIEMQSARRRPALLAVAVAGLLAAGLWWANAMPPPEPELRQATELPAPADSLRCPECVRRREVQEPGPRGRVFDRRDTVLVASDWHYTLALPPRPPLGHILDSARLNRVLDWRAGTLQQRARADQPEAVLLGRPVRLPLSAAEAERLRRQLAGHPGNWPGLALQQQRRRTYRQPIAAQALGYWPADAAAFVRDAQRYRRGRFYRLRSGGVESYYHGILAGQRGISHPLLDSAGVVQGSWAADTAYQAPRDLHLGLDAGLQAYAERLLGRRRGYIVALEPATGEILCFVSGPTYNPAVLTDPDRRTPARDLLAHERMPLLNRPALMAGPPGSVFKLVNAAVALQLGAIRPTTGFLCNQRLVNCVHHHPRPQNLTTALKYSCNPYFYQVLRAVVERPAGLDTCAGRRASFRAWRRCARSFGLDSVLGTDLIRESPGLLPTLARYDGRAGADSCRWGFRRIFSLSLGQGEINLTGLQIANVMAAIANRGWYIAPHFVRGIGDSGLPLPRFQVRHRVLVDSANLAALVPGMVAALERGGTAESASLADVGITVAGKTGTVENDEGDDHAVFAGFAPAAAPQIAVAVYLEGAGFGGHAAAPYAALIIEKYLRGNISPRRRVMERWVQTGNLHRRMR
ncbi:penicillin-binding transpeptidase domain-containing protein [uncultured Hymenobacter sp.]|uniref:penicillin-binding transpeptidase domain-containing protein n=1 Tax=uncultured Hymenobacter sp. TaxID=170016 RepID=UPI0035CAEE36